MLLWEHLLRFSQMLRYGLYLTRLAIRRHLRTIPRRDELIGLLAQERLRLHPESGKRIDRVVALALSMDHANGDDDDM